MITAVDHHVDALTAMLYPAHTKRCEFCGGFVMTTPHETLKRYAQAASEPLARFAQELESDFAGQLEKLISRSLVDRVQRYRDLLAQVAAGDVSAVALGAHDSASSERQAQLAREFAALGVRYYQSNLDLHCAYADRLLQQLAAGARTSHEPPASEAPQESPAPQTPPVAQESVAAEESSESQKPSAARKPPPATKKPPAPQ